jgi:hypothetical protein
MAQKRSVIVAAVLVVVPAEGATPPHAFSDPSALPPAPPLIVATCRMGDM